MKWWDRMPWSLFFECWVFKPAFSLSKILSQHWRLKAWNQGVGKVILWGRTFPGLLVTSGIPWLAAAVLLYLIPLSWSVLPEYVCLLLELFSSLFFHSVKLNYSWCKCFVRIYLQCRGHGRCGFDPWVGKTSWSRSWQPTPVFLLGKCYEQRRLVGYGPWDCKELDMTEVTEHAGIYVYIHSFLIFFSTMAYHRILNIVLCAI